MGIPLEKRRYVRASWSALVMGGKGDDDWIRMGRSTRALDDAAADDVLDVGTGKRGDYDY